MGAVYCSKCGKRVSNEVPEDLVVRAWIECPECLEAKKEGPIWSNFSEQLLEIKQLQIALSSTKERLTRLEEAIWGMSYDTAKDIVDGYIKAIEENPNIEASPSILLAERILGV